MVVVAIVAAFSSPFRDRLVSLTHRSHLTGDLGNELFRRVGEKVEICRFYRACKVAFSVLRSLVTCWTYVK